MYKGNNRRPNNSRNYKKPFHKPTSILPPPTILEQYEALVPGSAEKIVDMVDVEQDHRQKWEHKALKAYVLSYRIGQVFGLVAMMGIIMAAFYAIKELNNERLAYILLGCGFSFHLLVALISMKRKKFFERPFKKKQFKKR